MDRALEGENLEVKQDVDIWSMGCVYSEVSALLRVVSTTLRYYVFVPRHASGENGHTVANSYFANLDFRLKDFLLTQKCAGHYLGGPWLE